MGIFPAGGFPPDGWAVPRQAGGMKVAYLLGWDVWVCGEARNRHAEVWL